MTFVLLRAVHRTVRNHERLFLMLFFNKALIPAALALVLLPSLAVHAQQNIEIGRAHV